MRFILIFLAVSFSCGAPNKIQPHIQTSAELASIQFEYESKTVAIGDINRRGTILFIIDPKSDCQSCFDDLDEYFISFSKYDEVTLAYVCRNGGACDFKKALGPSYISEALTLNEIEPGTIFSTFNAFSGPAIVVLNGEGQLFTIVRAWTIQNTSEKHRFVGSIVRDL